MLYQGFISYSHADDNSHGRSWPSQFHKELETYKIPKDMIGTKNNREELIPD